MFGHSNLCLTDLVNFEAYLDLTVGEYSKVRSEGALSGPLSDSVQGRLSFSTDHHDGFYENATGPDLVENATINLRGQLNIDLSDQTSLLLSTRYSDTDRPNAGVYHQFGAAPDPTNDFLVERITDSNRALLDSFCTGFNGFPTMTPPGGSDCFGNIESSDVFSVSPDTIGFFERQLLGATGTLTWQVNDSVAFTSITDFQSIEKSYLEDNDSTSLPITTFFQEQDADQFSQEIRLSGGSDNTQWVVGAYYLTIDNDSQQRVNQLPFFDIEFFDLLDHQTDTYAVFGQTDFQLSDRVSLIAGLRWTEDEKDMDLLNDCFDTDAFGFGGTCNAFGIAVDTRIVGGRSDSDWSGKLELNYKPNDNWLWYIGATRGIKGGVLNAAVGAAAGVNLASLQIEPEALTSIEGGFKSTLANGRARLNVSVFSYDYSDYQAYDFVGVAAVLRNQDANSFGGEIELQATPVDGLDIVLGAAYLDSEVEDVLLPSGQRSNQEMPFAPELTFNGLVRYEWPAIGGAIAVQSDFSYVDDRFYSSVNHPVLSDDSYFLANARISYIGGDRRWDVTAFVNNLTDEEYTVYAFDLSFQGGGYAIESYAPPRWAGVSFSYRWD